MTLVYTDTKKGRKMTQQYVAPSVKLLGSLSDLTLEEGKVLGAPHDGKYFHGKLEHGPLTNGS
jgi:hypothetical protein